MRRSALLIVVLLAFAMGGTASAITFDEVPLLTTDPIIDGVSFWAGDPNQLNDTFVADFWTPGNPYLLSGYDDGTGSSPGLYDTFIGVSLTAPGALFTTVSFDIVSEYQLPPDTTLWLVGLLGDLQVGSMSLTVADNAYHTMSLSFASGCDTLYIYDDLDVNGFGETFHIDNFSAPPQPIPEPATILLLGSGLAGGFFMRRRRRA